MQIPPEFSVRDIEHCTTLSEDDMWLKHGTTIWQTQQFLGTPAFYPVYKFRDYYSYSPFALILLKGNLVINRRVVAEASRDDFLYHSGSDTLDREISRIGGPIRARPIIRTSEDFMSAVVAAVQADVHRMEKANPGYTNIVLCGGKDSQNLLLLQWNNPVVVLSGPPNFELVEYFVSVNRLPFDVVRLDDEADDCTFRVEALSNCCRNNLEHCRFGADLRKLAETYERRVVFWLGQLGDILMTPKWRDYRTHSMSKSNNRSGLDVAFRILARIKMRFRTLMTERALSSRCFNALWWRGAMWQGAHMSIMRDITDCLVVSGYHGPAMRDVMNRTDLPNVVTTDLRSQIGKRLAGRKITYPETNPSPPVSAARRGLAHPDVFLRFFQEMQGESR